MFICTYLGDATSVRGEVNDETVHESMYTAARPPAYTDRVEEPHTPKNVYVHLRMW